MRFSNARRVAPQDIDGWPVVRLKTFRRAVIVNSSGMDETDHGRGPIAAFLAASVR